jgi:transcriptional regulator with XRE-family HTH domain
VNGFMTGQVNGELVRARRLAAGLTPQELADRIGLTSELLWAIERGASDDLQHVPLLAILGLAEALDFRPGELLDPPAREASNTSTSESTMAQPDEVKLEAALLQYGAAITRDDLASAFGWTLHRVEVALQGLAHRLQVTGSRLRRASWNSYIIEPARHALAANEQAALQRVSSERIPLSPAAAAVLYTIMFYTSTLPKHAGGRDALAELWQRGLVKDSGRHLQPADEVLYSLRLDE